MEPWQLIKRIGRGVLYRRKVLAFVFLIGGLAVLESGTYYFFVSKNPPRYRTSATILLEIRPDQIPLFEEWLPRRPLPVQLAILQSRSLAESVLGALPKSSMEDLLKNPYYTDYMREATNFFRVLAGKEPVVESPQRLALQELQNSRMSFVSKGHGIVEIRAEASNARVPVDLVSTYIEVLVARTRSFNVEDARTAREFIEQQLTEVKRDLKASEEALAAFTLARGGVKISERNREAVTRLSSMESSLAEVQTNKRITETRLAALRQKVDTQGSSSPSGPVSLSQSVRSATMNIPALQGHLAQLERRLLELQGKYTDEHPRIVQVQDQITETQQKLRTLLEETSRITPIPGLVPSTEHGSFRDQILALETQVIALTAQEEALQTQIPLLRKTLGGLSTAELEYSRLLRDNDSRRRIHALLSDKLTGARTREQGEMRAVKVIDPPDNPLPTTDSRSLRLLALAAALALGLGVGIPSLVEYALMPVEPEDDLSTSMSIPVLGVVPSLRKSTSLPFPGAVPLLWSRKAGLPDRKAVAAELDRQHDELWVFTESFRRIRAAVQLATMGRPVRTILVTSTHQREGKSSVVFNMGRSFWEVGKRVILADADFYRPTLQKFFRVPRGRGLIDLLNGKSELQSALVPVADGLWVSGRGSSAPSEGRGMLANGRVREVIDEMTRESDLVLFDSSPLLIVPDNLFLASHVDAVILVAKAGRTRLRDLARAKAMIEKAGGKVIGVVINQAPPGPLRSYYKRYYRSYMRKVATT